MVRALVVSIVDRTHPGTVGMVLPRLKGDRGLRVEVPVKIPSPSVRRAPDHHGPGEHLPPEDHRE